MKTLLPVLFCIAMLGAAPAAFADDGGSEAPFYVGLGLGHVSVNHGSISINSTASSGFIDGSEPSWSLLGGYYFTNSFGVELGYHDYGKPAATGCPQLFSCPQVTAGTAEFLGKFEVVPQLDAILRLGVQEWNVGSPGGQFLDKTSGSAFIYGIEVSRHFDYDLSLEITYEHSSFSTGETRIGVSYSF
jgi:hypothetical protein